MKKITYTITVAKRGMCETYELESKKAKDKWLYEYLTGQERQWSWEQWQNSTYKTFDKWFKESIKPKWKICSLQVLLVNRTTIIIKRIENN